MAYTFDQVLYLLAGLMWLRYHGRWMLTKKWGNNFAVQIEKTPIIHSWERNNLSEAVFLRYNCILQLLSVQKMYRLNGFSFEVSA